MDDDEIWGVAAPEVLADRKKARAERRPYSGRAADFWSSGVVLYTMLFGSYPFKGKATTQADLDTLCEQICKGKVSYFFVLGAYRDVCICLLQM